MAALCILGLALLAADTASAPAAEGIPLRIVSLSPALSRTLAALGLAEHIVGRTPWCRGPAPDTPVVGDLHRIDYERLLRVRPTHVLIQSPAGGSEPELVRLARVRGWKLLHWPRLDRVADIRRTLEALPRALFGDHPPRTVLQRQARLLGGLDEALARHPCVADPGPLLLVTGSDPLLAFGRDTYLDDLVQAWGLRNALEAPGWIPITLEEAVRRHPGLVVWITEHQADPPAALQAAFHGHLRVLVHPDALLPAATLPEVATVLARVLRGLAGCRGEPE